MIESEYRHSRVARKILVAMAPIVCPPEIETRGLIQDTVDGLETFMRSCTEQVRSATALGLYAFEFSACLHPAHSGRTFSQLNRDEAEAWFALWWHSPLAPLREFAKKTKGLIAMCYFELPSLAEEIDYHPDKWIRMVARRRLDSYEKEIRAKEAEVTKPDPLMAALREAQS